MDGMECEEQRSEECGTGLELFLGFLIAIAVLAPCGIAYVTLQRVMLGNSRASASRRALRHCTSWKTCVS